MHVAEVYKQMATATLVDLRADYRRDRAADGDPVFVDARLALIATELRTRQYVDPDLLPDAWKELI